MRDSYEIESRCSTESVNPMRFDLEIPSAAMNWEEINKLEKHGREWEKDYLPEAFSESQQLIERARRRKFGDASPESGKA